MTKKFIFGMVGIAAIAVAAVATVSSVNARSTESDLLSKNLEALTQGETVPCDCRSDPNDSCITHGIWFFDQDEC